MAENNTKAPVKKAQAAVVKADAKLAHKPTAVAEGKLAILLVRGMINTKKDILATLDKFMLRQKHALVVVPNTASNMAAALKCKDYTTFGAITEETYKLLVEKRGETGPDGKLKKFFRMHPPRGGFERQGIKKPFGLGGALGHRKDKMNDLIRKML